MTLASTDSATSTLRRSMLSLILAVSIALGVAASAFANVITDWDEKALVAVTPMASLGGTSPYMAQRMMGIVHIAMFDAVNSIERRYRPYLVQLSAAPTTSKEAAAAAAAAAVLATIDAKTADEIKAALASYLASIPDGTAKSAASSSARPLRQRSGRLGRTTAPTRPITTGHGPRLASMCRRRSCGAQCGQASSRSQWPAHPNSGQARRLRWTARSGRQI